MVARTVRAVTDTVNRRATSHQMSFMYHTRHLSVTRLCTLCSWQCVLVHTASFRDSVSEWTKDNAVSFGLRDMTRRFCDCLGR